jgi:hypothetical protein
MVFALPAKVTPRHSPPTIAADSEVNYRKRKKESKRERDLKGESESAGEAQKQRQS